MRLILVIILFIVCICIFCSLSTYGNLNIFGKVWLSVVLFICFCIGGTIVNSCVLSEEENEKINQIVATYGDTYVKVEGDIIYVNVNGEWLNLSKIEVVGSLTKDCTIEYEGHLIYLGHSGTVSTLKVLEDSGFLDSEN